MLLSQCNTDQQPQLKSDSNVNFPISFTFHQSYQCLRTVMPYNTYYLTFTITIHICFPVPVQSKYSLCTNVCSQRPECSSPLIYLKVARLPSDVSQALLLRSASRGGDSDHRIVLSEKGLGLPILPHLQSERLDKWSIIHVHVASKGRCVTPVLCPQRMADLHNVESMLPVSLRT